MLNPNKRYVRSAQYRKVQFCLPASHQGPELQGDTLTSAHDSTSVLWKLALEAGNGASFCFHGYRSAGSLRVLGLENPEFSSRSLQTTGGKACLEALSSLCTVSRGGTGPNTERVQVLALCTLRNIYVSTKQPVVVAAALELAQLTEVPPVNLIYRQRSQGPHACTARLICSSSQRARTPAGMPKGF